MANTKPNPEALLHAVESWIRAEHAARYGVNGVYNPEIDYSWLMAAESKLRQLVTGFELLDDAFQQLKLDTRKPAAQTEQEMGKLVYPNSADIIIEHPLIFPGNAVDAKMQQAVEHFKEKTNPDSQVRRRPAPILGPIQSTNPNRFEANSSLGSPTPADRLGNISRPPRQKL